jgi:hypothetical protein
VAALSPHEPAEASMSLESYVTSLKPKPTKRAR